VFKSTDGATTWNEAGAAFPNRFLSMSLVIGPPKLGHLYVVSQRSLQDHERGGNWIASTSGFP